MHRKTTSRTQSQLASLLLFGIALTLGASAGAMRLAPSHRANDDDVRQWSSGVWSSATRGDMIALERQFANLPAFEIESPAVERFETVLNQRSENLGRTNTARASAREEAVEELRAHVKEHQLSQALRAAVKVQSFSEDYSSALTDTDIRQLIEMARAEIPRVEAEGDWLYAQELQYRLRTLFEDTDHILEYVDANQHLDWINRRVGLLAQYAPKRLHELRSNAAARAGQDDIPEFNPNLIIEWQERVKDVNATMVKTALRAAAREHIEADGFRPLLVGGLTELQIMATTPELAESFPNLSDPAKRDAWLQFIRQQIDSLNASDERNIDAMTLSRLLDGLAVTNSQTVQLERPVLYHSFGNGAMMALDQYSEVVWPTALRRFQQSTEGNFIGVGILIRQNERREIEVVNPLEGAPAYFAGVKPDDQIIAVDGDSTVGWSLNDAVDRITGKQGTTVVLRIRREGVENTLDVPIRRELIKLRSVQGWWKRTLDEDGEPQWDWYIDQDSGIAYIRLTQFTEDSFNDLVAAWNQIKQQGEPRGLIFDMRFNPGGLLDAAVRISNLFLDRGTIVSGENKDGLQAWRLAAQPNHAIWKDVPVVVLINKGSASASEIVAGALQAHGAAVVVGERSFGKGSVQSVLPITADSRLKLTTQYFRIPPSAKNGETVGRLIHKRPDARQWGVDPDIVIKMTPAQVIDSVELRREADVIPQDEQGRLRSNSPDRPDINRLLVEGIDPQLEMALLLLQARALADNLTADARHARR